MDLKDILGWVGAVAAGVAAVLWWVSTQAVERSNAKSEGVYVSGVVVVEMNGKMVNLYGTLRKQSFWSRWAAIAASVASACQAAVLLLPTSVP